MADDFDALSRAFDELPRTTAKYLRKAVEVSARNVKDAIRKEYSGSRNLPAAAGSISYDLHGSTGERLGAISAEIGPDLGGQGSLVGMVDTGTPTTPGKRRIPKAGEDEAEGFARGIDKAIEDGLREAGT